MKNDQMRYDAN